MTPALLFSQLAVAGTSLDVGVLHTQARDDLVVPIRSSGGGLTLGVGWHSQGPVQAGGIDFGLPIYLMANEYGHRSGGYALDLDGYWARSLGRDLSLGLALHGDVDQFYQADWDDSHVFWRTHWGIGPRVGTETDLAGSPLEAWASIPLVLLASRPPEHWEDKVSNVVSPWAHLIDAHQDSRITSVHQALDLHVGGSWMHTMKRGQAGLKLEGRLASTAWPDRITTLSTQLSFERRFGGRR